MYLCLVCMYTVNCGNTAPSVNPQHFNKVYSIQDGGARSEVVTLGDGSFKAVLKLNFFIF